MSLARRARTSDRAKKTSVLTLRQAARSRHVPSPGFQFGIMVVEWRPTQAALLLAGKARDRPRPSARSRTASG